VGRKHGHQWGNSWPPLGRTRWPLIELPGLRGEPRHQRRHCRP
jgi:hypothetical protein